MMSDEFERQRLSSQELGPKSGLSLHSIQDTQHNLPVSSTTRRVQPLQALQPLDLYCESTQSSVIDCNTGLTRKTSKSETQPQNQCNAYSVNNYGNCGLSGAMLPTLSYDNVVLSRLDVSAMNGRMSRRSSKATSESLTCSQQSILSAMDRFVKAVNNMDSTVLVPSKLRDMDMTCNSRQSNTINKLTPMHMPVPTTLANTDLHSFYLMLNDVKKELLWGPASQHMPPNVQSMSGRSSPRDLKHIRQPSDDSLGSMGSTASSSSDQDTDSDADSLMTDRDSIDEHTSHLAAAFRHHLQGLHTILHQLADSADYLSSRYQEDIDSSSQ